MSAIFDSSYLSGDAIFDASYADEVSGDIALITAIDAGNVSQGSTVITAADTSEPVINLAHRPDAGDWRHLHFALENAEGRRPIFKAPRTTRYTNVDPNVEYRPVWTQDFATWHRAPSRTLTGGATGTIDWQFDEPFPAGRVYVATQPLGRQADAVALTARLLDDYSAVCAPAEGADASGVYFTSPAELDGTSRECGGHPMFALQLRFGGLTTDGGPKRKLIMISGLHAAGEQTCWLPFVHFIEFVLGSADVAAVALRANWDINLYYNISPNGVYSGDNRTNPSRGSDPNRIWDTPNVEIAATQAAILADIDGGRHDAFLSWHGYSSASGPFLIYASEIHDNPLTRSDLVQSFLTEGTAMFGSSPLFTGSGDEAYDIGWAELVAGAGLALNAEVPQNGSTAASTYQHIGESWAKTLQAVDADGLFWASSGTLHATSGSLISGETTLSGTAARAGASTTHATSGSLISGETTLSGTATRAGASTTHATSGSLVSEPTLLSGTATRAGASINHATSGTLICLPATLSGSAFVNYVPYEGYPRLTQLSVSEGIEDEVLFERASNGSMRGRSMWPAPKTSFSFQHVLDSDQLVQHKLFYQENRAQTFGFMYERDFQTYTCVFAEKPKYESLSASLWRVSVDLVEA